MDTYQSSRNIKKRTNKINVSHHPPFTLFEIKTRLNSLRLGTFNVNGKLPSQDLFAWIQGSTTFSASLPPLKKLSPLSLGENEKNPFDRSKH